MHPQKWIDAAVAGIQQDNADSVSLKGAVVLTRTPDGTLQCNTGDTTLGHVNSDGCNAVLQFLGSGAAAESTWPLAATVRSIKRETGSKTVSEIKVRITAPDCATEQKERSVSCLLTPPELEDLVADGKMVSREQFAALAADRKLRSMLQNSSLQQVIREVDSSKDREKALQLALDNPQISALCDNVLDYISCNK